MNGWLRQVPLLTSSHPCFDRRRELSWLRFPPSAPRSRRRCALCSPRHTTEGAAVLLLVETAEGATP